MNTNADIRSLERLESFIDEVKHYRGQSLKYLEDLSVELRKLTTWIEKEAIEYWGQELKKAQVQYTEAQDTLSRCMSYVRENERRPCTEEKKRVRLTQQRRALCEEKMQTAQGAAKAWERDRRKNQGKIQRARDFAESEMQVAVHHLTSQVETLQKYASLRTPVTSSPPSKETKSTESESPTTNSSASDTHSAESAAPSDSS
ncbi:MAG: hypothetical protein AB8B50_05125 [Pirellulaceae bacterium]